MDNVFITTASIYSPRWQQAFATAPVLIAGDAELHIPADACVWLVLDGNWRVTLAACVQRGVQVVAMTGEENARQAKEVIAAGARGYIHYLAVPSLLQQVAQVIDMGGMWLGADLMRQLMVVTAHEQPLSHEKLTVLTPREQAVAEAVAAGKTNKEVARLLDITERTVKAHLGAIFEKLGVRDRLQLVLVVTGKP